MSGSAVRVAGLIIRKRPFDREANLRAFEELLPKAIKQGAHVVVTPEGFLEGYIVQTKGLTPSRYSEVAEKIPGGDYYERIAHLCSVHSLYVAAGMAEKDGERFYNTCALIGPDGKLIGKYRKTHTLNDEPLNTLGDSFPIFDTEVGKIGIMICYDRQLPETARILALHGAQMILNPAAGSHGEMNTNMIRTRAYENGVPVVFCHFAECLMAGPHGEVVARLESHKDDLLVADIPLGRARSTIDYRRPELYHDLVVVGGVSDPDRSGSETPPTTV